MSDLSPGDELLQWASEAGSGKWETLRAAAGHVARKHGLRRRPWLIARDLSLLGHLDIDWENQCWSIASPTMNVVPGLGLCVVLTGSRPYYLIQRFRDAANDRDVFDFTMRQPRNRDSAPTAIFAKCASLDVAKEVATRMGANFVFDPSTSLAASMPSLDDQDPQRTSPPDFDLDTEWFNPHQVEWKECESRDTPMEGLYRQQLTERRRHLWYGAGKWSKIDLAYGQFRALRDAGQQVMEWTEKAANGSMASRLEVHRHVRLPDVAERALTICDGRVPVVPDVSPTGYLRYSNVPERVCQSISQKLGQTPRIVRRGQG